MSVSGLLFISVLLLNYVGFHVALYRLFKHSGRNPWISLIPVIYVFEWLEILNRPKNRFLLLFVPIVNLVYYNELMLASAAHYNKSGRLLKLFWIIGPGIAFGLTVSRLSETIHINYSKWGKAVLLTLAQLTAVFLLRAFIVESYVLPTPSSGKSLLVGDYFFVSKLWYGPKIPNTPLSIPFVHHTNPLTGKKSYSTSVQWPYYRLPGFGSIRRNDFITFNFPAGDTVLLEDQAPSFYDIVRKRAAVENISYNQARAEIGADQNLHVVARPVDKRENYIKRCVGIPGDVLEIRKGILFINSEPAYVPENLYTPTYF